jgi:glycosyltransferase involved in cell wall biosynthesis
MNDVAIAWEGLPIYGARLIAAGRRALDGGSLTVLGTRPAVPLEGIESNLGQSVVWISRDRCTTWHELGLEVPAVFIHTGWAYRYFNVLAEEVRRSGGRVVSMVDNRWKANCRQLFGAFYFRFKLRRKFSALWVPGASGQRLAQILGMPAKRVFTGMYGADPELFPPGPYLQERPKRILFVGQYVSRKGVDLLASAWACIYRAHPDWELVCYGNGPEEYRLRETPGCRTFPFLQPAEIALAMRGSRFLVLPSRDDHWGVVVHEAALAGCGLIVSDAVGAGADLVCAGNGRIFPSNSAIELEQAIAWAVAQGATSLPNIYDSSRKLAEFFGPKTWASSLVKLVAKPDINRA